MIVNVNNIFNFYNQDEAAYVIAKQPELFIEYVNYISREKINDKNDFTNKVVELIDVRDEKIRSNVDIISKIYTSLNPVNQGRALYLFRSSIVEQNIFDRLIFSLESNEKEYLDVCLQYIDNEMCRRREDGAFLININDSNITKIDTLNSVLKYFANKTVKLKIELREANNLSRMLDVLKNYGEMVESLKLHIPIDDENIKATLEYTPFISNLTIESDKIIGDGLKGLKDLTCLQQLSLCCNSLTHLDDLPSSLIGIDIYGGKSLEKLPNSWPLDLEELYFQGCKFLKLPDAWPSNLLKLQLHFCEGLSELPDVSTTHLEELSIIRATRMLKLPDSCPPSTLKRGSLLESHIGIPEDELPPPDKLNSLRQAVWISLIGIRNAVTNHEKVLHHLGDNWKKYPEFLPSLYKTMTPLERQILLNEAREENHHIADQLDQLLINEHHSQYPMGWNKSKEDLDIMFS